MSLTMNTSSQASMGSVNVSSSNSTKAAGLIDMSAPTLPAKGATLTVRTNNTDGSLTINPGGHNIVTGSKITIFWPGGIRYNVTAGTVAGDVVPFIGAVGSGGDNLPVAGVLCTVMLQNNMPMTLTLAQVKGMLIGAALPFAVMFFVAGVLNGVSFSRDAIGDNYIYDASTGFPITGTIDNVAIVHSDATKSQTVTVNFLTDG